MKRTTNYFYRKKFNTGSFLRELICFFIPVFISCSTVNIVPDGNVNEQIKAENRIMKQNLTLAVRENSVLKDENIQYKGDNNILKSQVKMLESEIESLKKKHEHDVAILEEKYENLSRQKLILEQESSSKIKELTETNAALEKKLTGEIARLNEELRKQEETFNRARSDLEIAFTSKERDYQTQLARLNKELMDSKIETESLKSKFSETEANFQAAKDDINKKEILIRELSEKNEQLQKGNTEIKENKQTAPDSLPDNGTP